MDPLLTPVTGTWLSSTYDSAAPLLPFNEIRPTSHRAWKHPPTPHTLMPAGQFSTRLFLFRIARRSALFPFFDFPSIRPLASSVESPFSFRSKQTLPIQPCRDASETRYPHSFLNERLRVVFFRLQGHGPTLCFSRPTLLFCLTALPLAKVYYLACVSMARRCDGGFPLFWRMSLASGPFLRQGRAASDRLLARLLFWGSVFYVGTCPFFFLSAGGFRSLFLLMLPFDLRVLGSL